jgi:hypothetical protein
MASSPGFRFIAPEDVQALLRQVQLIQILFRYPFLFLSFLKLFSREIEITFIFPSFLMYSLV